MPQTGSTTTPAEVAASQHRIADVADREGERTQSGKAPKAINIAAFAKVLTWDPEARKQMPQRGKEFPADFVYPGSELVPVDDRYHVPIWRNQTCVAGLQWEESRCLRAVGIEVADGSDIDRLETIQVEYWRDFAEEHEGSALYKKKKDSPGSLWQGEWVPIEAVPTRRGKTLLCLLPDGHPCVQNGTMKVRWIFDSRSRPLLITGFYAATTAQWKLTRLRLEADPHIVRGQATISIYNGALPDADHIAGPVVWETGETLELEVIYSRPAAERPDTRYSNRTLLTLTLPKDTVTVAVEDALDSGPVYVAFAGVFVSRATQRQNLDDYRASIQNRMTIRQRVREMPDQQLDRAMQQRNPCGDSSPTLLSLACDNRKFVLLRGGTLMTAGFRADAKFVDSEFFCMSPTFGVERYQEQNAATWTQGWSRAHSGRIRRWLEEGWLPIVHNALLEGSVAYRQCTFVAPLQEQEPQSRAWCGDRPSAGVVAFTVENTGFDEAEARLELCFESRSQHEPPDLTAPRPPQVAVSSSEGLLLHGEKVHALISTTHCAPLSADYHDGTLVLAGTLQPGACAVCTVYISDPKRQTLEVLGDADRGQQLRAATACYWKAALASGCTIETPEVLVNNILRSSLVRILIAARNENDGERVAPWIAAFAYGALENESQTIIQCMTRFGFTGFARRCLDYFQQRYDEQGLLSTGYTMMGTPWNLWAMSDYFDLTGDRAWLRAAAPLMRRACRWIVQQRQKTRLDPEGEAVGEKPTEHGLVPPGVTGDWSRFGYRFYTQAIYCTGLAKAAQALNEIGVEDAAQIAREAADFRSDIRRAYAMAQARHPVLHLPGGVWTRPYPCMIYGRGRAGLLFPSGNRGNSYTYDVDHGAMHLAALGVLDPAAPAVDEMLDQFEDITFLQDCFHNPLYRSDRNHEHWFDSGGFTKYYVGLNRVAELYAQRDEVKLFIRSLFNCIPAALDAENLTFWEHGIGAAWDKTHHTAAILLAFRSMFVCERHDELWLAPFVPAHYFAAGQRINVRNVPTAFGNVSYSLAGRAATETIDAEVIAPTRRPPAAIMLRVRHPEEKSITSVIVNGRPHVDFDPSRGVVRLPGRTGKLRLAVNF